MLKLKNLECKIKFCQLFKFLEEKENILWYTRTMKTILFQYFNFLTTRPPLLFPFLHTLKIWQKLITFFSNVNIEIKTCKCWYLWWFSPRICGFRPDAAMNVAPIVFIFSIFLNSGLSSNSSKSLISSFKTRRYSFPPI